MITAVVKADRPAKEYERTLHVEAESEKLHSAETTRT